jgi:hypothetical protein
MSNPATDATGGSQVFIGDTATILGACTSISGNPGVNDSVTFTTTLGDVFTCLAGDISSSDQPPNSGNPGRTTFAGKAFGANQQVTAMGIVQSVTNGPWSMTGVVTVKLNFSGLVVTVSSGALVTNSTWTNTIQA